MYLAQTSIQRKKKPVWKKEGDEPLIMITALVLARRACVLTDTSDQVAWLVGMSYRKALSSASELADECAYNMRIVWPFPGKDPWGNENCFK